MVVKVPARQDKTENLEKIKSSELINQMFQACFETQAGRRVIEYLVIHSRALANGLKVVSNLKSVYIMSDEYYLAQSDFGKEIMSHLSPKQISELISSIITNEQENKK